MPKISDWEFGGIIQRPFLIIQKIILKKFPLHTRTHETSYKYQVRRNVDGDVNVSSKWWWIHWVDNISRDRPSGRWRSEPGWSNCLKSDHIILFLTRTRRPFYGYGCQNIEETLSSLPIIDQRNLCFQIRFQSFPDCWFCKGIRIVVCILDSLEGSRIVCIWNTLGGRSIAKNFESIRIVRLL